MSGEQALDGQAKKAKRAALQNGEVGRGMKLRLYLTQEQEHVLDAQGFAARALWNLLHQWWVWHPRHIPPTAAQADAAIRQGRSEIAWLAVLPAQAAQQVLKAYRRSWADFFASRTGTRKGPPLAPPRFKSRRAKMSVDVPQARDLAFTVLNRRWATVRLPKIGDVRVRCHRHVIGRIIGARLVKDALGWHLVLRTVRRLAPPAQHSGPAVGIDRGVKVPLALSDGTLMVHAPWLTLKETERLRRLESQATRRRRDRKSGQHTSRRLQATYRAIAVLKGRAARRRLDWQHQRTAEIAGAFSLIGVEDLRLKALTASASGSAGQPGVNVAAKRGLNRALTEEAHGRLISLLEYKSAEQGGTLVRVPAPYTSQKCHACLTVTPGSRESQARFVCKNPECGWTGHADTNAAAVIKHDAVQLYLASGCITPPDVPTAPGSGVAGRGALQTKVGAVKRQPKPASAAASAAVRTPRRGARGSVLGGLHQEFNLVLPGP